MITVIRTATAFPGMTGEAISWAKEVAALVKRVTGKEQFVCSSFGGMLAEIAWIGQYDSVGQYDEMRTPPWTRMKPKDATAEVSDDAGDLPDGDVEDSPPDAPA